MFDLDGNLTPYASEIIKTKCKGYVSYLRGENPITFPIRVTPDDYNDKQCITSNYPTKDLG